MTNLYDILGVAEDASQQEIRKAYKKQASIHHPDKNLDDPEATTRFQAIQKAYDILSDSEKRKRYDETGSMDSAPSIRDHAIEVVAKLYLAIAESEDFRPLNYFAKIRQKLNQTKSQCESELSRLTKQLERFDYLIDNTKASEGLLAHLQGKRAEIAHRHSHAEEGKVVMADALEYLDECQYTGDEETTFQTTRGFGSPFNQPFGGIINPGA